jgi:bifunctional non-homologous end joining protein LigD
VFTKLRGGFTLVRTGKRPANSSGNEQWLLIERRDEYADPSWDIENPRLDRSVLTGRSMRQIARRAPRNISFRAHA